MFGACKICKEKNARIQDLQEQLAYLRRQLSPDSSSVPIIHLEADRVLSASHVSMSEAPTDAEIEEEATRLLSGNY